MKGTKWTPKLWERVYRGQTLWVDEVYSRAPKWEWTVANGGSGRAKTRLSAMRAAERSVDSPPSSVPKGSK